MSKETQLLFMKTHYVLLLCIQNEPSPFNPHRNCSASALLSLCLTRHREVNISAAGPVVQLEWNPPYHDLGLQIQAHVLVDRVPNTSWRIYRAQLPGRRPTLYPVRPEVGSRSGVILEKRQEKPRSFLPVLFCPRLSWETRLSLS